MRCRADLAHQTELDFVRVSGTGTWPACVGPAITHSWTSFRLDIVERALFDVDLFSESLWDCFDGEARGLFRFTICAGHGLLLAGVVGYLGVARGDHEWVTVASWITRYVIDAAHWDAKEIHNLFAWRRAAH